MISDENLKQLRAMITEILETTLEAYGLKKPPSAAAVRQQRYRERQRNAGVTGHNESVTGNGQERNGPITKRNGASRKRHAVMSDESPVLLAIPLNDGTEFGVTEKMAGEFAELYPAVDVPQTLREIRGWNLADPTRRKTRKGVLKHINGWMAKEQNKGGYGTQTH